MTTTQLVTLALLFVGVSFFGYRTMQSSKNREATYANMPADLFHWLAAGIMSMLAPIFLSSIFIFDLGFLQLVLLAFGLFGFALLMMLGFAYFEMPAKEKAKREQIDRGWTEEDARTSGL